MKKNWQISKLEFKEYLAQFLRVLILNPILTTIFIEDKKNSNYCNKILNPKY